MRRIKLLYPPPYYYFKGFLQNRRFAKIGWIKLGDLTGLYAGSWKKAPSGEHREGAFFLVSPNGIFAFPLSVYAKFKKSQAYRKKITFYAPS